MARHTNCSADLAFIVGRDVCPIPSEYWHYACDILSIASGKEDDGGNEITTIFYSQYNFNYKRGRDLLQFLITNMNMGNLQDKTWAIYKTKHGQSTRQNMGNLPDKIWAIYKTKHGQSTRQNMGNLQDKTRRHQWPTTYIHVTTSSQMLEIIILKIVM